VRNLVCLRVRSASLVGKGASGTLRRGAGRLVPYFRVCVASSLWQGWGGPAGITRQKCLCAARHTNVGDLLCLWVGLAGLGMLFPFSVAFSGGVVQPFPLRRLSQERSPARRLLGGVAGGCRGGAGDGERCFFQPEGILPERASPSDLGIAVLIHRAFAGVKRRVCGKGAAWRAGKI
jgi:hypothetical protein